MAEHTNSIEERRMSSLLIRVRDLVRERIDAIDVDEKRMFGGVSLMVRGKLALAVGKDGRLLVRVAPERSQQLQRRPGAQQAVMGDRSMGPAWLVVDADILEHDADLAFWVEEALTNNARATMTG